MLVALALLMLEIQLVMFERLTNGDGVRIAPGFVLLVGAGAVFAVAGVLAARSVRQYVHLTLEISRRSVALAAAAATVTIVSAAAWGNIFEVETGIMSTLIVRLIFLTAAGGLLAGRLQRYLPRREVRIGGTVFLYVLVVFLFLHALDITKKADLLWPSRYSLLVVLATTVPFVSTLIRPSHYGAVLLATWSVFTAASWLQVAFDDNPTAGALLGVSLAAALGLAGVLQLLGQRDGQTGESASGVIRSRPVHS
jgi:hypothetical protein